MTQHAHPTAVYIERKPVRKDRRWSPAFSRRLPVQVEAHTAPITAVDYSSFHGVGRDITHALPHMWRYQALAIADKLSIRQWPEGAVQKVLGAMVVPGSRVGGQLPTVPRALVIQPNQQSVSNRDVLTPLPTYAPSYAKIM
jgi:hypothetical protein